MLQKCYNNDKELWKYLADTRRDIYLQLFYKIVNQDVNFPSEGVIILAKYE